MKAPSLPSPRPCSRPAAHHSPIQQWIYVTGAIRSGTTFVGTVLSWPRAVDYIHEPFNPQCGLPGISQGHRYIRARPAAAQSHPYHPLAESIFDYGLTLKNHIPASDGLRTQLLKRLVGSRGPFHLRLAKLNPFHTTAVIKDPIGLLLTGYLHETFAVKPVIVIKHPVSFIASLKRVSWWPSPAELFDQEALVEDFFPDEMDFVQRSWPTPLAGAAAFWRAVHKVLLAQASQHSSWKVIRHEDLSQSPLESFRALYDDFDLPWTPGIEAKLLRLTCSRASSQARSGKVQDFRRNSADIFQHSLNQLTRTERQQVFDITQDVADRLYPRESFCID